MRRGGGILFSPACHEGPFGLGCVAVSVAVWVALRDRVPVGVPVAVRVPEGLAAGPLPSKSAVAP